MNFSVTRVLSIVAALAGCALLQVGAKSFSDYAQTLIMLAGLYVTLAVSLNLINGITGQFSIGHAAFYQVGAYTAGVLAAKVHPAVGQLIWYVPLAMLLSAGTAAIAGFVVGLPSLRLRGDYLAIVTMGFGQIISIIARNQESLGKAYGISVNPKQQMIWLVWLLAIVCIAVCRNLLKNVHGLAFLAVREDEVASSAMGVNVTGIKVTAFVLGSAFAGAAGALFAHGYGFVSPDAFAMDVSFIILTMVVLGGTGSITGSAIAAVILFYIPEKMRDLSSMKVGSLVALAIALIVVIAIVKRLMDHFHGPNVKKAGYMIAATVGGIVLYLVLQKPLSSIESLSTIVEGSKLRMAVFAVTLIILMLLRPQGMFAHHEFSWAWVKSVIDRIKGRKSEVAA